MKLNSNQTENTNQVDSISESKHKELYSCQINIPQHWNISESK